MDFPINLHSVRRLHTLFYNSYIYLPLIVEQYTFQILRVARNVCILV